MAVEIPALIASASNLWDRGSVFLWALAGAALAGMGLFSVLALVAPQLSTASDLPWIGLALVALTCLAAGKVYQESTIKTMHFIVDAGASFWHHAPQPDGRKLTQIAIGGKVTNLTDKPVYPAAIRLTSPRRARVLSGHIIAENLGNRMYGFDNAVPPGDRCGFHAHFFSDGFIGKADKPLKLSISISDQFGHWHKVKVVSLQER